MVNELFKKMRMTEEEMKGKTCPQLSTGKSVLVPCLGRDCVSFTVTATHKEATVTVIADSEKADSVQADHKLVLDGPLYRIFIDGLQWKQEVRYGNGIYVLAENHGTNVNDTMHIAQYQAQLPIKTQAGAFSCYGYCVLNMKNDEIIK